MSGQVWASQWCRWISCWVFVPVVLLPWRSAGLHQRLQTVFSLLHQVQHLQPSWRTETEHTHHWVTLTFKAFLLSVTQESNWVHLLKQHWHLLAGVAADSAHLHFTPHIKQSSPSIKLMNPVDWLVSFCPSSSLLLFLSSLLQFFSSLFFSGWSESTKTPQSSQPTVTLNFSKCVSFGYSSMPHTQKDNYHSARKTSSHTCEHC